MKDDKRMTTRNEKGEWMIELNEELKMVQHNLSEDEFIKVLFNLTAQRLCDLEDKIENGTLVELPCKVGDTVYAPHWYFGEWDKIVPYQITNITITQNKKLEWTKKYRAMELVEGKTIDWQLNFAFDEVGKKVFLTKAEAEAKLAELKGE